MVLTVEGGGTKAVGIPCGWRDGHKGENKCMRQGGGLSLGVSVGAGEGVIEEAVHKPGLFQSFYPFNFNEHVLI